MGVCTQESKRGERGGRDKRYGRVRAARRLLEQPLPLLLVCTHLMSKSGTVVTLATDVRGDTRGAEAAAKLPLKRSVFRG
jgi:hypothetical protein